MALGGHMKAGRLAIGCAAMVAMAGAAEHPSVIFKVIEMLKEGGRK